MTRDGTSLEKPQWTCLENPHMKPALLATVACLLCTIVASPLAHAQRDDTNYDEAKVGSYSLPDPLVLENGHGVGDPATWNNKRRPEILHLFEENVYGRIPKRLPETTFEVFDNDPHALGGKAIRKQVRILFSGKKDGPSADMLLYLPPSAATKPVPVFLALSFTGNQKVSAERAIRLPEEWDTRKKEKHPASEDSRSDSNQWAIAKMLERGYGLATIYYCQIEPDFDGGIGYGVRPLFFKPGQTEPGPTDTGAIGAWAWGLSRALDFLETDGQVDAKRVAVMGHSRLGKTALWAGAADPRFALVVSNDSGEGGAALSRRNFGETIKNLNTSFPHWFCGNYKKYSGRAEQMPTDQHMLISLIAPRPVYVASAEEDRWADPKGEFLSAVAAGPVYRLFGKQGLDTEAMPAPNQPIVHNVGYHIRTGKHEVTAYDWEQFLSFADKHLKAKD